jgi:hypothetical protein
MNTLKICLILLIAFTSELFSQVNETWRRSYTFEIESRLIGCVTDNSGNIITGTSVNRSGLGEFSNFVIIKFNSSGDTLWRREYHSIGNKHDHLFDIYADAAGNVYATGLSTAYQTSEVATTRTVKYSPSGDLLWARSDSTNSVMAVNGETKEGYIQEGPNGDIFVATNKLKRLYVIRYTPSGNLVSHEEIDVPSEFYNRTLPRKFTIDSSGMYFFCSAVNSSYNEVVLAIKCNLFGDTLWTWNNRFNNNLHEGARDMTFDTQGNIYFLSEILLTFTTSKFAVTKMTTSSAIIWEKIYGSGNDRIIPTDLNTDNNNNAIVIFKQPNPSNNNKYDAVTIKYGPAGDSLWAKRIRGFNNKDVMPNGLTVDINNFIYVTGQYPMESSSSQFIQKYSPVGDSLWNFNIQGVSYWSIGWFVKIDNSGNAIVASSRESGIMLTKFANATSIKQTSSEIPESFSLGQNYPNPFNPVTVIRYSLIGNRFVTLKVFDVLGNEIATLVNEKQNSGTYSYQFSTVNYQLASGTYFYRLTTDEFSETKKMILTK